MIFFRCVSDFEASYRKSRKSVQSSSKNETAAADFLLNYLSDELHDLSQVLLLLQDLLGLGTQGHKLREVLVVILIKSASVFAVADQPVH